MPSMPAHEFGVANLFDQDIERRVLQLSESGLHQGHGFRIVQEMFQRNFTGVIWLTR